MQTVYALCNKIQEYAWGSRSAIPELLGRPSPAGQPQAELWMGAHPKAPSRVLMPAGEQLSLSELIARNPTGVLGPAVAREFSVTLPFLFKVLAAARPLSIQAHPDLEQARAGFRRENERGIPLDAFERNYRDPNHKPEVISALTPFWALNGFRPIPEMLGLLRTVGFEAIRRHIAAFAGDPSEAGLKAFFAALLRLDPARRERTVEEAKAWAEARERSPSSTMGDIAAWILRLAGFYPGDIGVLAPLLLNLIRLQPGDTMFLEAGVLHAYLEGTGIELMANSDNVIRGGLTPKHMDVEELLSVLRFHGGAVRLIEAQEARPGERIFPAPVREFRLTEIRVQTDQPYHEPGRGSIALMIVVEGEGRIETGESLDLRKGDSLVIPASTGACTIHGSLRLYRADVPL